MEISNQHTNAIDFQRLKNEREDDLALEQAYYNTEKRMDQMLLSPTEINQLEEKEPTHIFLFGE